MVLDGSVQRIVRLMTEIFLGIDGRFHQKIGGICFGTDVVHCLGPPFPDGRFKFLKVRAVFIVRYLFFGSNSEVFFKVLAEMTSKSCSILHSKLSRRQGGKEGKH
jgi:hypothetical protein